METITIKVDEELAKAYREADVHQQEKINSILKLFFQAEFTNKSLSQVMAEIAEKAEERGLTSEMVEEILNDAE